MYPNIRLPRPPASVITDRLAARAQPPIGMVSERDGLQFNSDVMQQIIRLVTVSGGRQSTCFLSQAHPYFFLETDQARVHAYFENQIVQMEAVLPSMEFQARFIAVLGAMHAAAGRLPVEDRLCFLVHLTDKVNTGYNVDDVLRQRFMGMVIDAGKSLGLGPQEGMRLFMAVIAGFSDIPGHGPMNFARIDCSMRIPGMLEKAAWLPDAERHALTMMGQVMAYGRNADDCGDDDDASVFFTDSLARASTWPHAWQVGMLHCMAVKLNTHPAPLQLASDLFASMDKLPVGQREVILHGLAQYIRCSLRGFFKSGGACEPLERLPQWLSSCKTLCRQEINLLNDCIGMLFLCVHYDEHYRNLKPIEEARIDQLAAALAVLNLSIPAGPARKPPTGLLSMVAELGSATESASAFKQLWQGAVVSNGLFRCLQTVGSLMESAFNVPEIARFLFEQFMLLPPVERYLTAINCSRLDPRAPLKADVAYAVVDHLPSVPAADRADVMSSLLCAMRSAGNTIARPIDRGQPAGGGRTNADEIREDYSERIRAQVLSLDCPGQGMTLADRDNIFQRITALLPAMDDETIYMFLRELADRFYGMPLAKAYSRVLDSATTMSAASQKMVALEILTTALDQIADARPMDSPLAGVAKQAFQRISRLPCTFRADALYALCRRYQKSRIQKSVWGKLFDFVLAELVTLPMPEQGRLLHILTECTELGSPDGVERYGLIERQAALLDPDCRDVWLLLIKLAAVDPEGGKPLREYAAFLDLKALCINIVDPAQHAAVASKIVLLDDKFTRNGFPEKDLATTG